MNKLYSVDTVRRIYTIYCGGGGYTCHGFDNCDAQARAVLAWVKQRVANPIHRFLRDWELKGGPAMLNTLGAMQWPEKGTQSHYEFCASIIEMGALWHSMSKERCDFYLTKELIPYENDRVKVYYPMGEEGEEDSKTFWVGKSGGWMPCHLEIKTLRSSGGGSVYFPAGSTVELIKRGRP